MRTVLPCTTRAGRGRRPCGVLKAPRSRPPCASALRPPPPREALEGWNAERDAARLSFLSASLLADLALTAASFHRPVLTWAGLAGDCVLLDALAGAGLLSQVPVVFIDTLHLFPETLAFLEDCEKHYGFKALRYTPAGCATKAEWNKMHSSDLFLTDGEAYDTLAKVEPLQRALIETKCDAWINGRRRDQGAERAGLPVFEPSPGTRGTDDAAAKLAPPAKINPLAFWTFEECFAALRAAGAPTHPLHEQGYPSIGDVHSTLPVPREKWFQPGGERAGRFAGLKTGDGSAKTECGIHSASTLGGGGASSAAAAPASSFVGGGASSSLLRPS